MVRLRRTAPFLAALASLLLAWKLAALRLPPYLLPPPEEVLRTLPAAASDPEFAASIARSLLRLGAGFTLASGRIEAAVMLEPWTTIARLQLDLVQVYDINQVWPESTGPVLATTERVIAEHPALLRALLQAHKKAAELSETHSDEVNRLLARTYFPQGVQTPRAPWTASRSSPRLAGASTTALG